MQNRIVIFDLDGTIYQNSIFHRGYLRTLVAGTWAEPLEADLVRLADEGYGAAILPERSAARLEHCEVLPLENAPSFDFVCAVPGYAEPSPACMTLIELARKHFATHG